MESKKFTIKTMKKIIDEVAKTEGGVLKLTANGLITQNVYDIIQKQVNAIEMKDVDKDILNAYKRKVASNNNGGEKDNMAF
ncbi:hypothetical protein IKI14_03995 [bacterium]|nr:hypothetical protein [bacterium]